MVAGLLVSGLVAWIFGKSAGWSAAYGAVAVIVLMALFARGIMGRFASLNAASATYGFFMGSRKTGGEVWFPGGHGSPAGAPNLNWLALVAGLFVTLKMYWLALLMRPNRKRIESLRGNYVRRSARSPHQRPVNTSFTIDPLAKPQDERHCGSVGLQYRFSVFSITLGLLGCFCSGRRPARRRQACSWALSGGCRNSGRNGGS